MPELLISLDAIRENTHQLFRAVLMTQGVDIDEDEVNEDAPKTAQDIYNETMEEIYGYDVELADVGIIFSDTL